MQRRPYAFAVKALLGDPHCRQRIAVLSAPILDMPLDDPEAALAEITTFCQLA